jgi:hypothetical protein
LGDEAKEGIMDVVGGGEEEDSSYFGDAGKFP